MGWTLSQHTGLSWGGLLRVFRHVFMLHTPRCDRCNRAWSTEEILYGHWHE